MARPLAIPLACWLILMAGVLAQAQDQGGSYVINPFEDGSQERVESGSRFATRISDENDDSAFRLPSFRSMPKPSLPKINLLPEWNRTPPRAPVRPSAWDKISGGAKSLYGKTRRTLMPWSISDKPPARTPHSSRLSGRTKSASKPRSGTKTLFSSWWKPKEEEKEIKTVNEWLSLPTVPYD